MRKKLLSLFLALIFILPLSAAAWAESSTVDGTAVFTAEETMDGTFDTGSIGPAVNALQPGDDVTFNVTIRNDNLAATDWYLLSKVIESLEDYAENSGAAGGAYVYRLSYSGPGGDLTIFDSDSVGGEGDNTAGEGLHQAAGFLKDYSYLDTLDPGQSGTVTLYVALDGDTQTNDYQDTQAVLSLRFAVEPQSLDPGNDDPGRVVKTGDESNAGLYLGLMGISEALVLSVALYGWSGNRKKKRQDKEEGEK